MRTPSLHQDRSDRTGTQSIARAVALVRIVAGGRDAGLGLSTIVALSGLSRPTVHRMLSCLVAEGVLEQRPKSRRYALGDQVQLLALSRTAQPPLVGLAEPRLGEIAEEIGDTLFLTLRTGLDTICVARRLGSFPIQVLVLDVGDRRPLGISSAGIAMLACLAPGEARAVLSENGPRLAPHGTTVARAFDEVVAAGRLGYALRAPGLVPGTRALSVPIRHEGGAAIGALTVAGISRRLAGPRLDTLVPALARHAAAFEGALDETGRARPRS